MPTPASPLQVLYNRHGKTTLIWLRNKSGDDTVKTWNLYWSPRFQGTYTLVKANIPNALGYSDRFVRFDLDRSSVGIEKAQTYFLRLTKTDWSGVESPQIPLETKIVYEDGVTLTNRIQFTDIDLQDSAASDVDYITPDVFDGVLSNVSFARELDTPIDFTISYFSAGADPLNLNPGEEVFLHSEDGYNDLSFNLGLDQYQGLINDRQIRFKTSGVSGGFFHLTIGRRRVFLHSNAMTT